MKKILFSLMLGVIIGGIYAYIQIQNEAIPTNLQISPQVSMSNEISTDKDVEQISDDTGEYFIMDKHNVYKFEKFYRALEGARENGFSEIYFQEQNTLIWKENVTLKEKVILRVPHILQYPELARGCEVTSLAMLLNYYGYQVDKMELAEKVKKDLTPYRVDKDGKIRYGNPYEGFVGDIYNIKQQGYGVYHGPITDLAKVFAGEKVIDITGIKFEDLLYFVSEGKPVWIVTNATFKSLEDNAFEIWHTPTGIVKITKRMHSVVITGYEDDYIYINDPLYTSPNRKLYKEEFEEAWVQMGSQAIIIME